MIPDLAWWGRLLGLLATEAALLVALAAVVSRLTSSAQWRRLIWQTAFLAVALVWFLELGGGRGWLARWRPVPAPPRQVTARVIGETTVRAEPVAFEFPAAVPVADLPSTPVQPRWWPGAFWLAGLGALWLKALGSRVWLAWRIRAVHEPELGQVASLPDAARVGRLAACPTLIGAPLAEGADAGGLSNVAATVARLRTVLGVGPVRLVAWRSLRGPVAFGLFRPTVAVPADFEARFTPVQREAMLAHELAHLANRDPLWLLVAELVCALAWWHPLMWWARRQFRAACEAAADEATALVPGGRVALAEALVSFGRELTAPGGVGVGGSGLKSELARRVQALVEDPGAGRAVRASGRWLLRTGIAAVLVALLFAPWPGDRGGLGTVLAAVRAEAAQPTAQAGKPLQTTSDVLADPQFREVVRTLETAPPAKSSRPRGHPLVPVVPHPVNGELDEGRYPGPYGETKNVPAPSRAYFRLVEPPLRFQPLPPPVEQIPRFDLGLSYEPARVSDHRVGLVTGSATPKSEPSDSGGLGDAKWHTRVFRLSAEDFTGLLQKFLPAGQTNLQLAVRAYFATNGIEFPSTVAKATGSTPPSEQPAIFYNDRTGQLFVRATLENLERIEQALQKLDLPPAEEAKSRAELEAQLRASGNTLAELRSRYRERHPRVVEAQTQHDDLEARLRVLSQLEASTNTAAVIASPAPTPPLFTRQFRVDPDKFSARVLAAFDPVAEAARKLDALPNRELIASDVGASVSRTALPAAVPSASLPGFSGMGTTTGPNLGEAIHAYFRQHGVDDSAPVPERTALFYKTDSGILFVRASPDDMAKVEQALVGLEPPVASTSRPGPQVQLSVFFIEIEERGADDLGLDWLFGQPRTNNPVPVTQFLTNAPGSATALQGDRLRVERLEVAGQWAVLSGEQFGALRQRLEGRTGVDFLSAPQVISLSGRQAQVSVGDVRTLVTGVMATDGSATNDADIRYVTDQVSVGPVVDLFPRAEGDAWRVRVVASLNEFLGYDAPGKTNRVQARTPGKPPMRRDVPLPRLRKRETQAEALAQPGEIIALRGPLAENVVQTKDKVPVLGDVPLLGRLFRSESQQIRRTRLYVFVQPETVDARGNRPAAQ